MYSSDIKIGKQIADSSQAIVRSGRDRYTGFQVVIKGFKMQTDKGFFRELKIFTKIEKKRREEQDN